MKERTVAGGAGAVKRGDTVVLDVERMSDEGDGIALAGDREVVLRRTVPGDRVRAVLVRKRKGRFEGKVLERVCSRVERVSARCEHFGVCGGCRWQDIGYVDQLGLKANTVHDAMARAGLETSVIESLLPAQEPFYYRNKMEFSFGRGSGDSVEIGLHRRDRYNRIFDLQACYLQSDASNRIVAAVRRHATDMGLSVYDLRSHQGSLRFLTIRQSRSSGEILVNLVVSAFPEEGVQRLAKAVLADVPEISTWIVSRHEGKAQVARGQAEFVLHGSGHLVEVCNGVEYVISPASFFQTNSAQAERLYNVVKEMAGDLTGRRVLDLFCGTGGIGLQLAREAAEVMGIESVVSSVRDAEVNARRNGIVNCRFLGGSVETILPSVQQDRFDLVVVDPPRAGLHPRARERLISLQIPRLVYVSCNPRTLADDLVELSAGGYHIQRIRPVDMFPHTPHCEVVSLLNLC